LLRGTIRRGLYRPGRAFALFVMKVVSATVVMILVLVAVSPSPASWLTLHVHERVVWMSGVCALGGLAYFAMLLLAGIRPRDLRYHV